MSVSAVKAFVSAYRNKLLLLGGIALVIAVCLFTLRIKAAFEAEEELKTVYANNARINAINEKSHEIGKELQQGKTVYEKTVKEMDRTVPVGATIDADSVRRLQARIKAGNRLRHPTEAR